MGHGYDAVADALVESGVRTLFGLLGNTNLALAATLVARGVRFVGARQETAAVSMAAGHAWAAGRPTACTVTHGPGLSNALTGLRSAVRDRLPVVLVVGDIRDAPAWNAQRADHPAMLGWTGARVVDCRESSALSAAVREAFAVAAARRLPVVVNIGAGLLSGPAAPQDPWHEPAPPDPPPEPDGDAVARAGALLRGAERPLVLAGRGALWSGAGPELRQLAERTGALLATSLPAKGLFAPDPFDLGVCGGYSTPLTRELVGESDVVLAAGVGLGGYTTDGGTLLRGARIVHCDLSPRGDAEVAVRGDARAVVRRLLDSVSGGGTRRRTPAVASRIAAAARSPDGGDGGGLDPREVLRAVDRVLAPRRQVVLDVGHFTTFPSQLVSAGAGRFLAALGFGSVGLSTATGIGAALGRDAPTLVVVGDGGALMSLGELETLGRVGAPVTVLVLNDSAYGAEIHHLRRHGLPEDLALFPRTDFAAVARALGVAAVTWRQGDDLGRLAEELPTNGPVLVDALVTRSVVADKFISHNG
ncbi:thiamine pyrophosphate-binding protein [Phytohabitans suffuscus]|uniref:Acetolactate synthase I/II/III large subunit n=1 Tax=Phytohabitans suffuscus TaxID=624315 RepID=A0A6F8YAG4_9ACTN|nr:thiamine pyrophosphate-binding protein [Phytohabitans suffuscus]BCB83057.1 acetolactate synthase I/II/III large subunit [Phytohabitans suffuscus]